MYEFHHILRQSADDVIEHHLEHKGFARWIHAATGDDELCHSFAASERALGQTDIGAIREALVQAIDTNTRVAGATVVEMPVSNGLRVVAGEVLKPGVVR